MRWTLIACHLCGILYGSREYPTLMIKNYLFFRKQQTLRMTTLQAKKK